MPQHRLRWGGVHQDLGRPRAPGPLIAAGSGPLRAARSLARHVDRRSLVHTACMWRDPVIEVYKQHVDRTLLRENLKLTVEERFRKLMDMQRFAEELQRAGREARRRGRTL